MATGTLQVVDYSFSRIDHGYARSRGVVGAMRYLYRNGKGLTAPEVALFRASGLKLGLNYEAGAGDFIGRAAGLNQAQQAKALMAELGLHAPIIFSADFDVQPWQYQAVGDALGAALEVLGRGMAGLYGHARLMAYVKARFGDAAFRWQTYAWSGGVRSPYADLYQYLNGQNFAGGQVDFNEITGRTFWAIGGNTYTHTTDGGNAVPIAPVQEDDVAATETIEPGDRRYFHLSTKRRETALVLSSLDGPAAIAVENDGRDFLGGEQHGRFSVVSIKGTRRFAIPAGVTSICVLNDAARVANRKYEGQVNWIGASIE